MPVASDAQLDPYAYLEHAEDPATVAWTAEQNARTRRALDALPQRLALASRLEALLRIDTLEVPVDRGGRLFYVARRGDAEQAVLYVRDDGRDRALVDPASLDPSGLTALDWWHVSPQGRFVAFGLSSNGDESSTLHVLDVAAGTRLDEAISDTRHCSLAWFADERGFFYTRYPAGGSYDVRLYRHVLGAPWPCDERIFGDGRKPEEFLEVVLSPGGRRLAVVVHDGWSRSDVYVADTHVAPFRFEALIEGRDAYYDVQACDDALFVRSDDGAPRFRMFEVAYDRLARETWHEIVPEAAGTLDGFAPARGALVLHYLDNARSRVRVRRADGRVETLGVFEGSGVTGISSNPSSPDAYVCCASYLCAPAVLRVSLDAQPAAVSEVMRAAAPFDERDYRVVQEWYVSKDGTRVPLTVIARGDLARDGSAPGVLYGYGGFNVSLLPAFTPALLPWLDAGGVYAIANLRGGGEFGDAWHRAGMRERKQNVFDDAIAAIEYLGTSGIADAARIAIVGGSNGGLLAATVAVQRPALLRAVVADVPLTDMLRFHKFLIARLWIAEYGDPDDPGDATFLRAYSPYHNVVDGVPYPAMLITTAESDGRVDPMHARKFGARVVAATSGDGPTFIFVEPSGGHGAGTPRHKVVAELADRWAFIFAQLGVAYAEATAR